MVLLLGEDADVREVGYCDHLDLAPQVDAPFPLD